MAAADADLDESPRKCPYCPLRYYAAGKMRSHLQQTHSNEANQLSESQAQSLGIRFCTGCGIWCIDRLFDKDAQYKGNSSWSQHQCRIPSSLSPPQSPSYSPPDDVPPAASSISTNESSAVDDEKFADENSTNSENSPDSDNSNVDTELATLHLEYDGIVHNSPVETNLLPESVESLANHGPIDRNISLPNRAAWINVVKAIMNSYLAATDSNEKLASLIKLLKLPSCLSRNRGGTSTANRKTAFRRQRKNIEAAAKGDMISTAPAQRTRSKMKESAHNSSFIQQRAHRIHQLLSDGHVGRAAQTWTTKAGLADLSTPEAQELIRDLHPQNSNEMPTIPGNSSNLLLVKPDKAFVDMIHSLDNGSSPGLSGWTPKLILATTIDETCLTGFAQIVNDIMNGRLPASAKEFLLACNLIAIEKPNNGLRPIAIGEIFYRLAAKIAKSFVSEQLVKILEPIQLGINTSGGCETVIHSLTAELEDPVQKFAAVAIDFQNAFNSIDRQIVLKEMYSHNSLKSLWPIVDFAYSEPSDLLTRDHERIFRKTVISSQGVRQGDPLSSLLFAVAIHPLYESILSEFPQVRGIAIHDDFTLVGPIDDLLRATEALIERAKEFSLVVQQKKCKFIYFHSDDKPLNPRQEATIRNFEFSCEFDSTIILGCPIASNESNLRAKLNEMYSDEYEMNLYAHDRSISSQDAILLLRISLNRKLDYLLRCIDPRKMLEPAEEDDDERVPVAVDFDDIIRSIFLFRLGFFPKSCPELFEGDRGKKSPDHLAIQQARLPVRLGGFGLTKTADRASFAYLASLANSLSTITSLRSFEKYAQGNQTDRHCGFTDRIKWALMDAHRRCDSLKLPRTTSDFCAQFVRTSRDPRSAPLVGLQKNLTDTYNIQVAKKFVDDLTASGNLYSCARLKAVQAPGSSNWITAFPSGPDTTMTDFQFCTASSMRLNIHPMLCTKEAIAFTEDCLSCHTEDALNQNPWHWVGCNSHLKDFTTRHDSLCNVLARHIGLLHAEVVNEPTDEFVDSDLRPDLKVSLHQQVYYFDFTVAHPLTESNLTSAQAVLGTTTRSEGIKDDKYLALCEQLGAKFVPFAFETYGGLGAKAKEFLSSLARFARENSHVIPPGEIMNSLRYSLAVVLQKGNALIIQRAMNRATSEANKVAPHHIKRSPKKRRFVLKSPKKHRRCPETEKWFNYHSTQTSMSRSAVIS
jgi:hypothetical protein